ncbi:Serine/threonine-protein kinase PknB [Planctomycetes bacterium K23_9]|uniref:Serine/threonine-protein kinase PknB n=1 Tax=Stieleria marina TaxID=1930275 RepID=A0A517P1B2_9BACT|nr:Serine/threonine-protein kinase PknB [Planctomycetes bacterium K23_9]
MNLGQPKPGKYRPRCKQCGKQFILKVTDDEPAKIGIGRIKPKQAKPPLESSPADDVARTLVDETMDSTGQISPTATASASVSAGKSAASADVGTKPHRTSVSRTKVNQTAANVDATIDQTVDRSEAVQLKSAASVRTGDRSGASVKSPAVSESDDQVAAIPERLGGYKVMRMIGRGAMGAVYEAKQISLDRIVALKTIRSRLANNPASLARFTREAYAAAQLTHHNVVQIYDFGEDNGRHFFSMEWVRGGPLSDLIRNKGAIEPKRAAGYALQAARGLQFAHQNGMVHRDVKPANLLLSDDGVVKVADLGLVKIPDQIDPETEIGAVTSGMQSGTQVTMMGTAVGTPAYMAPEQGIDAASVDHRADIYSLGCSLFYMLTGRPPFDGSVVSEVMQQHAQQALPSLVDVNARVPAELNEIVQGAMAKRPSDRFASLAEMIHELESYLGVSKDGSFSPTSEQADQWETIGKQFAEATTRSRLSTPVLFGFALLCGLLTLAMPFIAINWLLFAPAMFVTALVVATVLAGSQSAVGTSARRWLASLSWFDYLVAVFGSLVALLVGFVIGLWLGVMVGMVLGAMAGAAYHFLIVVPTQSSAEGAIKDAEKFVRDLRIDGADEDGVRSFVARYAGNSWQPLYESLFGYESLCQMREQLGSDPSFRGGSTRGGLRDKVSATLQAKAEANRHRQDQKRLAKIEELGLASQGVSAAKARDQAWQMAQAIVANARDKSTSSDDFAVAAQIKRERQKVMLADARSGKYKRKRDPFAIVRFALGGQSRLIAGSLLLALFAIWAKNAGLVDTVRAGDINVATLETDTGGKLLGQATSNWSIGLAGLLLSLSAFVSGWRMTPFAIIATIVILFGPTLGVPGMQSLQSWMVSAAIGVAIYVPGIIFGEQKNQ